MNPYTEAYYENGQESGLSNYSNYRWLPDLTLAMADHVRWLLGVANNDIILDFGSAKGFLVKALRMRGVEAYGYDISEYAVANCDPEVRNFVSNRLELPHKGWDHIWSKDVFEHIPADELEALVPLLLDATRKQIFIIVPLALSDGGEYGCPLDELDKTHVVRWTLPTWLEFLQKFSRDFVVAGGYEMPVLKPNCYHYPKSYGFISIRRVMP